MTSKAYLRAYHVQAIEVHHLDAVGEVDEVGVAVAGEYHVAQEGAYVGKYRRLRARCERGGGAATAEEATILQSARVCLLRSPAARCGTP